MTDTTFAPVVQTKPVSETRRTALILAAVAVYLGLWATAVVQFGVPGLYLPALAKVPVMWGLLIWIARG
ncbi:MAG: hypothetical protein GJ676_06130 [Rhodobacteraceae bacterium]|nr:hypothetical protein [Paracoccaceae bacterium]